MANASSSMISNSEKFNSHKSPE
uniref:Uncharacterized protein n=1 Tax=Rhizophora mucronata TaxID=61149 RepID=A0A2P2N8Z0_RHIMU